MNKQNIGIIFDFDGTLDDSQSIAYAGVCRVCEYVRVAPPTYADYLRKFHVPYMDCYRQFGVELSPREISDVFHEHIRHMRPELFPETMEVVRYLTTFPRVRIGIVTVRTAQSFLARISETGIRRYFDFISYGKEDKAPEIKAFSSMFGIATDSIWFIGDTKSDMEQSKAAGVNRIGITQGNDIADMLRAAGAEHIIGRLPELIELVGLPPIRPVRHIQLDLGLSTSLAAGTSAPV